MSVLYSKTVTLNYQSAIQKVLSAATVATSNTVTYRIYDIGKSQLPVSEYRDKQGSR